MTLIKDRPRSVTGQMVLDYLRVGWRWIHIARIMGVQRSYVRYVDHKYNWKETTDGKT